MNAIPRECDVLAALPADQLGKAVQIAKKVEAEVKAELAVTDAGFRLEVEENPAHGDRMFCPGCSAELIDLMYLLPYGVRTMSMEIPGLVICSVNEAVVKTEEEKVVITMLVIRSADGTIKANLGEEILPWRRNTALPTATTPTSPAGSMRRTPPSARSAWMFIRSRPAKTWSLKRSTADWSAASSKTASPTWTSSPWAPWPWVPTPRRRS